MSNSPNSGGQSSANNSSSSSDAKLPSRETVYKAVMARSSELNASSTGSSNSSSSVGQIADAIWDTLRSPNVVDSNLESANVVDTLNYIAEGLDAVANSIGDLASAVREHGRPCS